MSAPAPPRHIYPVAPSTIGFRDAPATDGRRNSQSASGSDSGDGRPGGRSKPFPHMKDLVYRAETQADPFASITKLLETAGNSVRDAQRYLDFGRLDLAYVEYLSTTYILSVIIPKHKDAPEVVSTPRLSVMRKDIIMKYHSMQSAFDQVQATIAEDNRRSGILPVLAEQARQSQTSDARHAPQDARPRSIHDSNFGNGFHAHPSPPSNSPRNSILSSPVDILSNARHLLKPKPPPISKPQNLSGASLPNGQTSGNVDALSQRFAKLRTGFGSGIPEHQTTSTTNLPDRPDSRASRSSRLSTSSHGSINSSYASTGAPYGASVKSPTIPTNDYFSASPSAINTKDLPKAPDATYSPSRQVGPGPNSHQSQRNSRLSMGSAGSAVYLQSNTNGENGFNHAQSLTSRRPQIRNRGTSVNLPRETEITAEKLYDYLKSFSILLIDVRSREDYDEGHILAPSALCIEPTALRANMSAEELEEALVISPAEEEALFSRRNEFDLVVYFDQSTTNRDFLTGKRGSPSLKYLYDALYEFNEEKPLRWGPILLIGGVDAWVGLLGAQSLVSSNTVPLKAQAKAARPIARRPAASQSSQIYIQKRRLRDYNPLDQEEESKWRGMARHESFALDALPKSEAEEQEAEAEIAPYVKNYDDFMQKFPDVATVEQQYMSSRPPSAAPPRPPQVPNYPTPPPRNYAPPPVPGVLSRPVPSRSRLSYRGESERQPSTTLTRTPSAQLAPYVPAKMRRLPRTGLHNFGVTCYMNSTIQCLSATVELTNFFIDGSFMKFIQKDNWKGSKGLMPELYTILLRNLWETTDADTIRPTNFRKFCARLNREWGIDRQQDAKEFLDFLLDCLHEDLNVNWSRNPLRALTDKEEAERERTPALIASKREWDRYRHRDDSKLTELFAGQHISRLQCTTCHNSSTTYEPFWSISVEIPPAPNGRLVDIRDCLRSYCSSEVLSGDEVWRCPHCRKEREATKRITISRAPEFLVIHFKRFSAGTQAGSSARKIHTPIEFPLTGLDLTPFVLPPPDAAARDHIGKVYGDAALETPFSMTPPYKYDAYAVLRHLGGTMTSGHYIALVRDKARNCWREFNDDRVSDFRPEDLPPGKRLQNEQAYIVFYQRSRGP